VVLDRGPQLREAALFEPSRGAVAVAEAAEGIVRRQRLSRFRRFDIGGGVAGVANVTVWF